MLNMKNAVLLHGKPSRERYDNPDIPKPHEANWLPWLSGKLGELGVSTTIPAFPKPYAPDYADYKEMFEELTVNADTALIGHSAGAEFALRWLSERNEVEVDKLILVAPWQDAARKYGEFSNYTIDFDLAERVGQITIFNSLDDSQGIQETVQSLRMTIPRAKYIELNGYGHFMLGNNMTDTAFPELLTELTTST